MRRAPLALAAALAAFAGPSGCGLGGDDEDGGDAQTADAREGADQHDPDRTEGEAGTGEGESS